MSSSVLSTAISGLQAAQAGLATTGHNIANVNTPGFSRQESVQANRDGIYTGSGYFGRGVDVQTILRRYDSLLVGQARTAQAAASHYAAAETQASALDNLLADPQMGLAPALAEFFAGVNAVSAQPGDAAARQSMLSASTALAARFQLLDEAIGRQQSGVDRRIETTVASVNETVRQVALLNDQVARQSSTGQPPNDLLDRRDALVRQLNTLVSATAVVQSDGTMNLYMANGQALVVGTTTFTLQAAPDRFDPARRVVGLATGGGFVEFTADTLFGGELGGLLAVRQGVLDPAQNALGRLAISLGDAFNAQHRLGQDRTGTMGTDYFRLASPWVAASTSNTGTAALAATFASTGALTGSDYDVSFGAGGWTVKRLADGTTQAFASLPATVDGVAIQLSGGTPAAGDRFLVRPGRDGAAFLSVLVTDPARIAAGAPVAGAAATTNSGTGTITPGTVTAAGPNLAQPVTITFTGPGTFSVTGTGTGNPTGLAYTPGMTLAYNGWQVTLAGSPAAGDTFTVTPGTGATGDNRNALALSSLQGARFVGGNASPGEAFAALVASVGSSAREAQVAGQAQEALAAEADGAVQRVSGVNLDEEAANLLKYQQAYQAAGKVIQAAAALFDTLLSIGDR